MNRPVWGARHTLWCAAALVALTSGCKPSTSAQPPEPASTGTPAQTAAQTTGQADGQTTAQADGQTTGQTTGQTSAGPTIDTARQRTGQAAQSGQDAARAVSAQGFPATGPLPEQVLATLRTIRPDPPPKQITKGTHYWISNEYYHHYWHDVLKDRGGAYVGVGSEQNYTLAGWARSELLILMDFDQAIADTHQAIGAAFRHAETPEAFHALWKEKNFKTLREHLAADLASDPAQLARTTKALDSGGTWLRFRFRDLARDMPKTGKPHFLTDAAMYGHLRRLWLEGRVVAIRGDLTADQTMQDIGRVLTALKVPLRVLYTSNAEQYFPYGPGFRRNILALPLDDKSLVLRTHPPRRILSGRLKDNYHYNQQSGPNFQAWMRHDGAKGVGWLLRRQRTDMPGVEGASTIEKLPPAR